MPGASQLEALRLAIGLRKRYPQTTVAILKGSYFSVSSGLDLQTLTVCEINGFSELNSQQVVNFLPRGQQQPRCGRIVSLQLVGEMCAFRPTEYGKQAA